MDKFVIHGGKKLYGTVAISGAKNAILPLLAATLLAPGSYSFSNVPNLRDVRTMVRLLTQMGVTTKISDNNLDVTVPEKHSLEAPYDLVRTMRASFYVLGPIVARFGYGKVSLPGGCAWGPRPVNFHLEGLKKMGVDIEIDQGYVIGKCDQLHGAHISFDIPSVGATGNLLMAATLAKGTTILENVAMEPEIQQLAEFLIKMGAQISGIGTKQFEVIGVPALHPASMEIIPDRIEAGTYLACAAIAGGEVTITNVNPDYLSAVLSKLESAGVNLTQNEDRIRIQSDGRLNPINITTDVYPGFPTDMQAQWIAMMTTARGSSTITDKIYFDRFTHVSELNRLGANIEVDGNTAIVRGVAELKGATTMSTDLRASASLILAGLIAQGKTEILRVYHIDRGYEKIEEKLRGLGADIQREKE
ncbi:UDP-N-acetylglucosamine 1-carboxyvinyltransferase [candidate division KSB1 bacterium]|nr:UDP-N-acetylglucosamine 1-carboxyvinyltransferase [candidate division KSB1 bacterium]